MTKTANPKSRTRSPPPPSLRLFLSANRKQPSEVAHREKARQAESDYGRVVFASSTRRLQHKTQVFPLEDNASVRSRLTHSLEVAYIGRLIAHGVTLKISSRSRHALSPEDQRFFITIAETACLAHDIGNPPFGHFGESVIRTWFHQNEAAIFDVGEIPTKDTKSLKRLRKDFTQFDGNPQGFRILTRLTWERDPEGLNLTASLLCGAQKYTALPHATDKDIPKFKKAGWFFTENSRAEQARASCKLVSGARHPIALIMEAADDIAYCLSDIEDGLEKRLYTTRHLKETLAEIAEELASKANIRLSDTTFNDLLSELSDTTTTPRTKSFFKFKTDLTRHLVERASDLFVEHLDSITSGSIHLPLLKHDPHLHLGLSSLGEFAKRELFCKPEAEHLELAGQAALRGILDAFKSVLTLPGSVFQGLDRRLEHKDLALADPPESEGDPEKQETREDAIKAAVRRHAFEMRLAHLLPEKHILAYHDTINEAQKMDLSADAAERYARAHLVVDFVSGMTDRYALALYQRLSGTHISIGRS